MIAVAPRQEGCSFKGPDVTPNPMPLRLSKDVPGLLARNKKWGKFGAKGPRLEPITGVGIAGRNEQSKMERKALHVWNPAVRVSVTP